MKGLVLKDLYNVSHNEKTFLVVLVIISAAISHEVGLTGAIFCCASMCSMLIMTTFLFDDKLQWSRYALTMPISRKELVASKFIVLLIFSIVGIVIGFLISMIGGLLSHESILTMISQDKMLLVMLTALAMAMILGGLVIPLLFRFGTKNANLILLVAFFIPIVLILGLYKIMVMMGIELTDSLVIRLLFASPIVALLVDWLMYCLSCRLFQHKSL